MYLAASISSNLYIVVRYYVHLDVCCFNIRGVYLDPDVVCHLRALSLVSLIRSALLQ